LGEVFQDIARLFLDRGAVVRKRGIDARLGGHALVEVARELTGREDEMAGAGGGRVVASGRGMPGTEMFTLGTWALLSS